MQRQSSLAVVLALAWLAGCNAQLLREFQWGFKNNSPDALIGCSTMTIEVKSLSDTGTGPPPDAKFGAPPYYAQVYEVGGPTQTQLIGTDRANLRWTVQNKPGAKLLLSVIDSNGISGGSPKKLLPVVGTNTTCVPIPRQTTLNFRANVTTTLKTCQPWGFEVTGGVRPYTLSLPALDSPVITNITIDADTTFDVFTYVNRAAPGGVLMGSISDATGAWAPQAVAVNTTGGTDFNCKLDSQIGNSVLIPFFQEQPAEPRKGPAAGVIVAAVLVPLVVLALLAGAAFWLWRRRRAIQAPGGQDTKPRVFDGEAQQQQVVLEAMSKSDTSVLMTKAEMFNERERDYRQGISGNSPTSTFGRGGPSGMHHSEMGSPISPPGLPDGSYAGANTYGLSSPVQSSRTLNSTNPRKSQFPSTRNPSYGPLSATGTGTSIMSDDMSGVIPPFPRDLVPNRSASAIPSTSRYSPSVPQRSATSSGGYNRRMSDSWRVNADGTPAVPAIDPEFVIQHQDGGSARDLPEAPVTELPPPYMDRSLRPPSTASSSVASSSLPLPPPPPPMPAGPITYPDEKASPYPGDSSIPPSPAYSAGTGPSGSSSRNPLPARPFSPGA